MGKKVLVVDDEKLIVKGIRFSLEQDGMEVFCAYDGEEALQLVRENDFDIITSYESDSYCKPNPMYYKSICERLGVEAENCLMIGNDEREDGFAAKAAISIETAIIAVDADCAEALL